MLNGGLVVPVATAKPLPKELAKAIFVMSLVDEAPVRLKEKAECDPVSTKFRSLRNKTFTSTSEKLCVKVTVP